jgi:hypothetical protein
MFRTFGILVIAVGATVAASAAEARGKAGGNGGSHAGGHASMGGRVTDHRGGGAGVTHDHRGGAGPVVRDHRGGGVVAPPPPMPGRPVVSGGVRGDAATNGNRPTIVDGRPARPGIIIDPCRGNGCPGHGGHGHHGRPFGFGGGGVGVASAAFVPSNEECFLETRRIQGVVRQVRTCTTPHR